MLEGEGGPDGTREEKEQRSTDNDNRTTTSYLMQFDVILSLSLTARTFQCGPSAVPEPRFQCVRFHHCILLEFISFYESRFDYI